MLDLCVFASQKGEIEHKFVNETYFSRSETPYKGQDKTER
jgi:hypothetical protein